MKKYLSVLAVFIFLLLISNASSIQAAVGSQASASTVAQFTSLLKSTFAVGTRSSDVKPLQQFLKNQGYYLSRVDGYFGPITDKAVKGFQKDNGLAVVVSTTNADPIRCPAGSSATTTAGVTVCSKLPQIHFLPGCTSTSGFSTITGESCGPITTPAPCPPGTVAVGGTSGMPGSLICSTPTAIPVISYLSVNSGTVATQLSIFGQNFTASNNTVNFGSNVIENVSSVDGRTLTFTVPSYNSPACLYLTPACAMPTTTITPGTYPVSITNANGMSNSVNFYVLGIITSTQTH